MCLYQTVLRHLQSLSLTEQGSQVPNHVILNHPEAGTQMLDLGNTYAEACLALFPGSLQLYCVVRSCKHEAGHTGPVPGRKTSKELLPGLRALCGIQLSRDNYIPGPAVPWGTKCRCRLPQITHKVRRQPGIKRSCSWLLGDHKCVPSLPWASIFHL